MKLNSSILFLMTTVACAGGLHHNKTTLTKNVTVKGTPHYRTSLLSASHKQKSPPPSSYTVHKSIDNIGPKLQLSNLEIAAKRVKDNMKNKLNDDKWTTFVDKLALKDYAMSKGIPMLKTLKVYEQASDVDFTTLPKDFAIKSNKGSGRNIIIRDNIIIWGPAGFRDLNGKSILDPEIQTKLRNIMEDKWSQPYRRKDEPQYEYTVVKIFQEEFITDEVITDVKFFISNGKATQAFIYKDLSSQKGNKNYYNADFTQIDCPSFIRNNANTDISNIKKHSKTFERYINLITPDIDLDFYRIDFYMYKDEVFLGEITLSPLGGSLLYHDSDCDGTLLG